MKNSCGIKECVKFNCTNGGCNSKYRKPGKCSLERKVRLTEEIKTEAISHLCKIMQCSRIEGLPATVVYEAMMFLQDTVEFPDEKSKEESAWEMFRRLNKQYPRFSTEIHFRYGNVSPASSLLFNHTEQEAIKIMQEIEKAIKE